MKFGWVRSLKALSQHIYLSPPHMGEYEERFVAEAFATNWVAPLGPQVDAFERELAEVAGMTNALALTSGTAAIHLALRLLGVGQADTVFCSTLTFVASANPILYQGGTPVFIDSEPETWNMSPHALARAFEHADRQGKLPKAIVIVNLYGQSADMEPPQEICERYDVPIVEDAAESIGASYRGKPSGSFGKFGIFSFNGNKIITTSGGGALVSDDKEALAKARFWATQARDPALHYEHSELGYNYRMSNILAGIGRGQLRVLADRVHRRREIFQNYVTAFQDEDGFDFMPEIEGGHSTRWLTALTVDPVLCGVDRDAIIRRLEAADIEARPVWKPLHIQPLFKDSAYYPHADGEDVSAGLFHRGLCLPSGSRMSEADQCRVIGEVKACLHERRPDRELVTR
jgi:pyridoxal phosphate-dependent aminotransferase EpsN